MASCQYPTEDDAVTDSDDHDDGEYSYGRSTLHYKEDILLWRDTREINTKYQYHIIAIQTEKAAELGHAEAQRMVANSLASGILPISDHSLMHRLAKWQYQQSQSNTQESNSNQHGNWISILLQSTLQVEFHRLR